MREQFEWLLGKYTDKAAKTVQGNIILEETQPFSTVAMDAGFVFSTTLVDEIRKYLTSKGIEIKNIVIMSAMQSNLQRTNTVMVTESSLLVVEDEDGNKNALFFSGCTIDDK